MYQTYRIVPYIAGRGAKVDDRCGQWAGLSKHVDMRHHVVTGSLLLLYGRMEVDIHHVCFHLFNLGLRYVQSQFLEDEKLLKWDKIYYIIL